MHAELLRDGHRGMCRVYPYVPYKDGWKKGNGIRQKTAMEAAMLRVPYVLSISFISVGVVMISSVLLFELYRIVSNPHKTRMKP